VGTILIVLLGFTLDIGRSYYAYLVLKDAAGEGAYYGSVHPSWVTDDGSGCDNPHNIMYRVRHAAPTISGGLIDIENAQVSIVIDDDADGINAGDVISVTATASYQLVAPFVGAFVGSQDLPLTAVSSARILAPADNNCPPP
jgi:hypothetical protein